MKLTKRKIFYYDTRWPPLPHRASVLLPAAAIFQPNGQPLHEPAILLFWGGFNRSWKGVV